MKHLLYFCTISFLLLSINLSGQDFTISNYHIEMDINTDGSLNIEEHISVYFSKKKRGIFRSIPLKYKKDGKAIDLGVSQIDVAEHKFSTSKKRGELIIKIGDKNKYLEGAQSYKISYKIQNGIQDYPEHQELYFDLIGNDWKAEIEKLSYQIHLPRNIAIKSNDLKSTTGFKNQNTEGLSIKQINPTTIQGNTNRKLSEGEGATIAIKLPKTYLSVAELANNGYKQKLRKEEEERVPQKPWLVLFPIGLLGVFITFWKKILGSKYKPDTQESYAYPPEGLTSAHVGAYIDQTANTRDIVSLIPYWASEGFLTMEDVEDDTLLTKTGNIPLDYPSYERLVFNEIFKNGQLSSMSDLKEKFYRTLHKAKSDLTKEVHSQGYYKEDFIYWFRSWRIILFPFAMFLLAGVSFAIWGQLPMGFTFIGLGIISFFFGLGKIPMSNHGEDIRYKLDGLKKFLEEVPESEIESIITHDPKYFEKMLPFAVAFGIEKGFIPKFSSTMDRMPNWYISSNNKNTFDTFQSGFSTETISSAFTTSPHSSSSGSSGGGFSSGGGSGGGGGGSW